MTQSGLYGPDGELVMPLVVCKSQGGPYDDESFIAGMWLGIQQAALVIFKAMPSITAPRPVPRPLLPQLDLMAMNYGYELRSANAEGDNLVGEWSFVSFVKKGSSDGPNPE